MNASGLSSRQKVLFDCLTALGEWITSKKPPVNVKEVFGFGSYFRGKVSPKDVDLLLVYHAEPTAEFVHFLRLLEIIRTKRSLQRKYDTPKEALIAQLMHEIESGSPEASNCEGRSLLFENWLEKYSWSMLFPAAWQDQFAVTNPAEFTRRVVRRQFPNLNVVRYCRYNPDFDETVGLRCRFKVSLWNENQTNLVANLNDLLSKDAALQNAWSDLEYFYIQLPLITAQVKLLCAEIRLLLRVSMRAETHHAHHWLETIGKCDHDVIAAKTLVSECEKAAKQFDKERGKGQPTSAPEDVGDATEKAIEWRNLIKDRYAQLDVLEWVRQCLLRYKQSEPTLGANPWQFVYHELQSRGSAADRKKRRTILERVASEFTLLSSSDNV